MAPITTFPALDLRFAPDHEVESKLHALLDDFALTAIQDHDSADGWLVFFSSAGERDGAGAAARSLVGTVLDSSTSIDVPDQDWARRSQANLTAIRVGRIIVTPPWDVQPVPRPDGDAWIQIVIDPSMGFGTGHHQTTRLCLRLLQRETVAGRRVVDVGTGSGVLALAAHALGAAAVLALDSDPDALQNARENIERNNAGAIELACADVASLATSPADLAMANLTAATLIQHAGALRRLVASGGTLIASGFSPADLPEVLAAYGAPDAEPLIEDDWAAAMIRM